VERQHRLHVDIRDDAAIVDGDLTRLVQVLGNLLNNAAKYMDPGGSIELTAMVGEGVVEFRVKDEGIGIAPESQAKLFNLFSRLDDDTSPSTSGLGIGLALVRQLVELHDGKVSVVSAGLTLGSEFTVRLPLATQVVQAEPKAVEPPVDESMVRS